MKLMYFDLNTIHPNPFQPRQTLDSEAVAELAQDILSHRVDRPETLGLLQIPLARPTTKDGGFHVELAYGHRRLEAFRWLAGCGHAEYTQMPIEIEPLTDIQMATLAWSENQARSDISVIEQAAFIKRIMEEFGWTSVMAATYLGVPKGTLSNYLRLLDLPERAQQMIRRGEISPTQGKELVILVRQGKFDRLDAILDDAPNLTTVTKMVSRIREKAANSDDIQLYDRVIEPAAITLRNALLAGKEGAWELVMRVLIPRNQNEDPITAVTETVIRRLSRAPTVRQFRVTVNQEFEKAGLTPPWNGQAMTKVDEFLKWTNRRKVKVGVGVRGGNGHA